MMTLPIFSEKLNSQLAALITKFNATTETDHLQRLFYLQKIDYSLKNYAFNDALLDWVSSDEWKKYFRAYSINENASFFLKSIQFAQAVAKHAPQDTAIEPAEDIYKLLQARDALLKNNNYETCKEQYLSLSLQIKKIAEKEIEIKTAKKKADTDVKVEKKITDKVEDTDADADVVINLDVEIESKMIPGEVLEKFMHGNKLLQIAKGKIEAIQGQPTEKSTIVATTTPLGPNSGNNANFNMKLVDTSNPSTKPLELIIRVEDRDQLRLEHELHSFPVAEYFNIDIAVFMKKIKDTDDNIDFRPVVISEKANQGNLENVAKELHKKKEDFSKIYSECKYYFTKLIDFQEKLMAAKVYHPDIKLSNFLVHNNLIRVSDRKTFLNDAKPFANKVRTTVVFATDEYRSCLNAAGVSFTPLAKKTQIDMPEFMAYQLGMALKHFLALTQLGTNPSGPAMRNSDLDVSCFFKSPSKEITNLWLLARGLTHPEVQKRLSLANFKKLLNLTKYPEATFYEEVRAIAPFITPDISVELRICNNLLKNTTIGSKELVSKANLLFSRLLEKDYDNDSLQLLAEKLAVRCYNEYIEPAFTNLLTLNNWNAAPWYRKMLYWVSFGYWGVDAAQEIDKTLFKNMDPELIPFLRFLPEKELNNLGGLQHDSFFEALVDRFFPSEKPATPAPAMSAKQKISATLPLKKDSGITGKPTNNDPDPEPLPTDSTSKEDDSNDAEVDFSSTVYKAEAPAAAPIPAVANHPPLFKVQGKKVDTVNTAMMLGDGTGSNRRNRPPSIKTTGPAIKPAGPEIKPVWTPIKPAGKNDSEIVRIWDIFSEDIQRPKKVEAAAAGPRKSP